MQKQKPIYSILTTLYSKYAALCCKFFFKMSTPFRLICLVKLPLFPNFYPNTSNCKSKNLYAAFWQFYAANVQQYAAKIFFFCYAPFLYWFVMWNYPYSQIFSLIQPIAQAKGCMQHFENFLQQICSIMLQKNFLQM